MLFSSRSKTQALSETRDHLFYAVEAHFRINGNQIRKTENHIGYQIRKTVCILAENRKPNAKKRKNRKPQHTPKPKNRSFSVQKPKNRSKKWPKPQNRKSQRPPQRVHGTCMPSRSPRLTTLPFPIGGWQRGGYLITHHVEFLN